VLADLPDDVAYRQIGISRYETCGVTTDGELRCTPPLREVIEPEVGAEYTKVSVGHGVACALDSRRRVRCFGNDPLPGHEPVGTFLDVGVGDQTACVVRVEGDAPAGTVECWGKNDYGQHHLAGDDYVEVLVGEHNTCGRHLDGTVTCTHNTFTGWFGDEDDCGVSPACLPRPGASAACGEGGCVYRCLTGYRDDDGDLGDADGDGCETAVCGGVVCPPHLEGWPVWCNARDHCEYAPEEDPRAAEVYVPPGVLPMGSPGDEDPRWGTEGPVHDVTFARGFWIGKHEVTVAQYQACRDAPVCGEPSVTAWEGRNGLNTAEGGRSSHPQNGLQWRQCGDYCAWREMRLPSESEWEYAAKGPEHRKYPWGDAPEPTCANDTVVFNEDGGEAGQGCGDGGTTATASTPARRATRWTPTAARPTATRPTPPATRAPRSATTASTTTATARSSRSRAAAGSSVPGTRGSGRWAATGGTTASTRWRTTRWPPRSGCHRGRSRWGRRRARAPTGARTRCTT